MGRYLTEFVGTFFLVLTIGFTVLDGTPLAPLAIGASLMVMVYMGGHVSGAHYNPAISLAVLMRGKLAPGDFIPYLAAQLLGALTASGVVYLVLDRSFSPARAETASVLDALVVEFLYTFALGLVVLNSATAKATQGNSFYGLAIGFTIVAAAAAGGPISGGAFNPAVGMGPGIVHALVGHGSLRDLWIYVVGPVAGGAAAAQVFRLQNAQE